MSRRLVKYLFAAILPLLLAGAVWAANPTNVCSSGTLALVAGAQTIPLGGSYARVVVWLSSGSSTVHITFNNTAASTSNALLDSGAGIGYGLSTTAPARDNIRYFGNGAVGSISWLAF